MYLLFGNFLDPYLNTIDKEERKRNRERGGRDKLREKERERGGGEEVKAEFGRERESEGREGR